MILVWLTTCVFSLASALLPFLPMEVYILGAGAKYGDSTAHAIRKAVVTISEARAPMARPRKPAISAPRSGRKTMVW